VTGSGSGLGAATARMIIAGGGKAVLADLNKESGDAPIGATCARLNGDADPRVEEPRA